MSRSRFSYEGYGVDWILKSDVRDVSWMRSRGVYATYKQLIAALPNCGCGWITTGGHGHLQHVRIYSLDKLRSLFPKS